MLIPWGTELTRTDSGSCEIDEDGIFSLSVATDVVSSSRARAGAGLVANAEHERGQEQEEEHR